MHYKGQALLCLVFYFLSFGHFGKRENKKKIDKAEPINNFPHYCIYSIFVIFDLSHHFFLLLKECNTIAKGKVELIIREFGFSLGGKDKVLMVANYGQKKNKIKSTGSVLKYGIRKKEWTRHFFLCVCVSSVTSRINGITTKKPIHFKVSIPIFP